MLQFIKSMCLTRQTKSGRKRICEGSRYSQNLISIPQSEELTKETTEACDDTAPHGSAASSMAEQTTGAAVEISDQDLVPEGYLAVYVQGVEDRSRKRYIVPMHYMGHNLFKLLREITEEELEQGHGHEPDCELCINTAHQQQQQQQLNLSCHRHYHNGHNRNNNVGAHEISEHRHHHHHHQRSGVDTEKILTFVCEIFLFERLLHLIHIEQEGHRQQEEDQDHDHEHEEITDHTFSLISILETN